MALKVIGLLRFIRLKFLMGFKEYLGKDASYKKPCHILKHNIETLLFFQEENIRNLVKIIQKSYRLLYPLKL